MNYKRTIYHIEYSKNGPVAASGGEVCMLENIKYLLSKGEKNIILTTEKGKKAFKNRGLEESNLFSYRTISLSDPTSPLKLLLNYFKRLLLVCHDINDIEILNEDIIFCHSDFFPNSIPFYRLSKKNPNTKLFAYLHMLYPSIWRGYVGQFTGKFSLPTIGRVYLKLSQWLYFFLLKNIVNDLSIIAVNPSYSGETDVIFANKNNIKLHYLKLFGGVEVPLTKTSDKVYDAIWMGRFHEQKGINELFDIVKKIKISKNDVKVAVIGGGSLDVEENFKRNVILEGLTQNIIYLGFISDNRRFEILSQAKVFLMTSYFEGRPIVMIEVMKIGLPIVAYDLPVYSVYGNGIVRVPILDNATFAERVLQILNDENTYSGLVARGSKISAEYSWVNTGHEIYSLF